MRGGETARRDIGEQHTWLLAALAIFLGTLLGGRANDLLPSSERLILSMAAIALLGLAVVPQLRRWMPLVVVLFLVTGGLYLRWVAVSHPGGSDVLAVTREALATLLAGQDPYAHYYTSSRPAGAPFVYPPVNLLIHLPGYLVAGMEGVRWTELVGAGFVLVVLARHTLVDRLPIAGIMLAAYAALPNLVNLTGDGSNDTTAGTMLVLYLLLLMRVADGNRRSALLAGIAGAAAIATKQSALPIVVAGSAWMLHLHRRQLLDYLLAGGATLGLVSLPFLVVTGPVTYLRALTSFAGFHSDIYGWNIWVLAGQLRWPVADAQTALVIGLAATVVALVGVAVIPYRSLRTAVVAGTVATAILFMTQRWTTYAYFAELMPVVLMLPLIGRLGLDVAPEPAPEGAPDDGTGTETAQTGALPGEPSGPEPRPDAEPAATADSTAEAIRATAL